MSTTLVEAQAKLAEYQAAESRILEAQEVRLGGPGIDRWLRFEDLQEVRAGRKEWEATVTRLQNTAAAVGQPTFGGLSYALADFSADRTSRLTPTAAHHGQTHRAQHR